MVSTSEPRQRFRNWSLKLAEQGMAVVFISSEIEEMLRTCDRMVVMRDGAKVGELSEDEMNQSNIMSTIAGGQ